MAARLTYKLAAANTFPKQKRGFHNLLDIHHTVKSALCSKKPVVALESTIITHGMPYPRNFETALEVEDIVRSVGATPATIACIDGRLKVGLSKDDIKLLSETKRGDVLKCSRRDLAYVVANRKWGGTTVAATMIIANMAGIRIFATGGVGGVHRDGHISMDISADLVELGRTPVVVVSSGVKSILDIPRTLEYLETQGVCVASYDNEGLFPDFYTRDSGCVVPYNLEGPKEAAALIKALENLKLNSGMLIGVPIPKEYAVDKEVIKSAIEQAYIEAKAQGIEGKSVTPFMLAEISKITQGNSLHANIALIKNNARVAAHIACALSDDASYNCHRIMNSRIPLVIGASILDLCLTTLNDNTLALDGATYHTRAKESAGGVGRNMAEAILKLHGSANFVSVVGNDHMGKTLLQLMPKSLTSRIHLDDNQTTSVCSILFDKSGNCKLCLANMEIHKTISPELIRAHKDDLQAAPLVIMDGNLSVEAMEAVLDMANDYDKPVFFEPTDMLIAGKPFTLASELSQKIRFISPNIYELKSIVETLTSTKVMWEPNESIESGIKQLLEDCRQLLTQIEDKFDCIVVTLGSHGVLVNVRGSSMKHTFFDKNSSSYRPSDAEGFTKRFYAAPTVTKILNVSGAGDSFSSGFIAGILKGLNVEESVALGFVSATRALQSQSAVPERYFDNEEEAATLLRKQISSLHSTNI